MTTCLELKEKLASMGIVLKGNHTKTYLLARALGISFEPGNHILGNSCPRKGWEMLKGILPENQFNSYYNRHKEKSATEQKKAIRRILRNHKRKQLVGEL